MKLITLTHGKVAIVNNEDYERINRFKWFFNKSKTTESGYAIRNATEEEPEIYMHRMIMRPPKNLFVDHKDTDGLNNRKGNLRFCNSDESNRNKRIMKTNKSGFKGVCLVPDMTNRWRATINGKHLGVFYTPEAASEAYKKAAREMHGDFARFE